jgi:hypothetical protein
MVEEIALPIDLRDSGRDPFKIADEIGKLGIDRSNFTWQRCKA